MGTLTLERANEAVTPQLGGKEQVAVAPKLPFDDHLGLLLAQLQTGQIPQEEAHTQILQAYAFSGDLSNGQLSRISKLLQDHGANNQQHPLFSLLGKIFTRQMLATE